MLSLIIGELNAAVGYLWEDDCAYAYHTGKAGGIALAVGAKGLIYEDLWGDISDAYEGLDLNAGYNENFDDFDPDEFEDISDYIAGREGAFWDIISKLKELPEEDSLYNESAVARMGWEERWVALNEAVEAKVNGDWLRYSLMIGFVSGLMVRNPGPQYPGGSILDAIEEGYRQDMTERLEWAKARLAAGHRLSDPGPFMGNEGYEGYMNIKLQMMRRAQNFGLYGTRAEDDNVAMPNSMRINSALRQHRRRGGSSQTQ